MQCPRILTLDTPTLGDRTYLAHDGDVALVVDPQRDIDRVLALAQEAGVRITHVVETHLHNDYVTGGLALARATGAHYCVNALDDVGFDRTPVEDGDVLTASPNLQVQVIATPGHTFTHLSYALQTPTPDGEPEVVAVFTGGSLLYGTTGRPDLLGPEHTHELVAHQLTSAKRLATELPDSTEVLPTHGFGSFCSPGSSSTASSSTIGTEKRDNPVLTQQAQQWMADTVASLEDYPAYYVHMEPANRAGPAAPDLTAPRPVDAQALATRLQAGEWVVDLRTATVFAAGHVRGTLNIGLDGQFATYLGWLLPWGTPLTLLGDSPDQVAEAQRELVRIGVDELAGAATGTPSDWTHAPLGSYQRADFEDLAQVRHHRSVSVLDVRRPAEFAACHLQDALNVPLHELLGRLDEVPSGEVWVHCASGYRASIAASVLAAHDHQVVLVDVDFEDATASSLPLVHSRPDNAA